MLIAVALRPQGPQVLFTRRAEDLPDHAGQISFPGGRFEPGEDALACALREAREETGIDPGAVEVLGELPRYRTITSYDVVPVVGLFTPRAPLRADPAEVSEIFEVPLAHLMDDANWQRRLIGEGASARGYFAVAYEPGAAPAPASGHPGDRTARRYFIWGATAAMLRNLYRFLQGGSVQSDAAPPRG